MPADVHAVVASGTSLIHEHLQSLFFQIAHCVIVAVQEGIKGGWRDKRCLVCLNRLGKVVKGDRGAFFRKRCREPVHVVGHRIERGDHIVRCVGHFDPSLNWPFGLFGQIRRTAIPELRFVEHRVQHSWRVSGPFLPTVAN